METTNEPAALDQITSIVLSHGFLYGFVGGFVVAIIVVLLFALLRRIRSGCQTSIEIKGEHGCVLLNRKAAREFVIQSLEEFAGIAVKQVHVYSRKGGYIISVDIDFARGTNLAAQKDAMQQKIVRDLQEKAGVISHLAVELRILSFSGSAPAPVEQPD
jgi:hypothetical protein